MDRYIYFDVDGVLVKGQSQQYLIRYLFRKRKVSAFLLLKLIIWFFIYKIGFCSNTETIRTQAYSNFKGWDIKEARKLFKDFFQKEVEPCLNKGVIEILNSHLQNNDKVVLISAGLKDVVGILADQLGVKYYIASELEENGGKYTGNLQKIVPYGKNKVKVIKDFFKNDEDIFANSWVYADHFSDLPLLRKAKSPCVVNPSWKLRKYAKKSGWKIYKF